MTQVEIISDLREQKKWELQQEEINHEQETNCADFLCV